MSSFDIITIGAATIDNFIWSRAFHTLKSDEFPTGVAECFSLGSKIEIDKSVLTTGGGATNAAATFANLGFKTGCLVAIGDDIFGAGLKQDLKKHKINTALVKTVPGGHTAFSNILLVASGERTILVARGASEHFSPAWIAPSLKAQWIYLTSVGGNFAVLKKIFAHAAKNKIKIFWNPGTKDLALGRAKLKPLIAQAEIFDVNREEAALLTGFDLKELKKMIAEIRGFGPAQFLLTDGGDGAYLANGDGVKFLPSNPKVKVVNRTGAGDAFGSGFLAGLIKYGDRDAALCLGLLNAEGVIAKIGAKTGLLKSFPARLSKNKIKILDKIKS